MPRGSRHWTIMMHPRRCHCRRIMCIVLINPRTARRFRSVRLIDTRTFVTRHAAPLVLINPRTARRSTHARWSRGTRQGAAAPLKKLTSSNGPKVDSRTCSRRQSARALENPSRRPSSSLYDTRSRWWDSPSCRLCCWKNRHSPVSQTCSLSTKSRKYVVFHNVFHI